MRLSQNVQFVDEHRIFGVSKAIDPGSRWSVTLLDTSVSVEDPRKPREIEFGLDFVEPPAVNLTEGTYARGARQGSPFRTDRKRHILCITPVNASGHTRHPGLVVDYGSICAIASENETTSSIPWDLWKHKTTPFRECLEHTVDLAFVGPRLLMVNKQPHQGLSFRSYDFTPGACRFIKQADRSFDDPPRYVTHCGMVTDGFPEGDNVVWVFSEDNILTFPVS